MMADKMTITEALADLKTLSKRIGKKREFVSQNLIRQERFKDPLEREGGQRKAIQSERQSIADLEKRAIAIRMAIAGANAKTTVTVEGESKTIAEWLVWRREVAPGQQAFLNSLRGGINNVRAEARQKGLTFASSGEAHGPDDIIVNMDEMALAEEAERLETILGALDGQLSLKNATVTVTV